MAEKRGKKFLTRFAYRREFERRQEWATRLGWLVQATGVLCGLSVIAALLTFSWGELTGHWWTDGVVLLFVGAAGPVLIRKGHFLKHEHLCRFCLKKIPPNVYECPECGMDLTCADIEVEKT